MLNSLKGLFTHFRIVNVFDFKTVIKGKSKFKEITELFLPADRTEDKAALDIIEEYCPCSKNVMLVNEMAFFRV